MLLRMSLPTAAQDEEEDIGGGDWQEGNIGGAASEIESTGDIGVATGMAILGWVR